MNIFKNIFIINYYIKPELNRDTLIYMKKIILLIVIVVIVIPVILVGLSYFRKKSPEIKTTAQPEKTKELPEEKPQKVWKDPMGFSFSYFADSTINDHQNDNENYAHVELVNPAHDGYLIVWVKDLPLNEKGKSVKTLDEWLQSDAEYKDINKLDTQLGGQPAVKLTMKDKKRYFSAVMYDDLLYLIEVNIASDYWKDQYDLSEKSFVFESGSQKEQKSGSADYNVSYDEEEILE